MLLVGLAPGQRLRLPEGDPATLVRYAEVANLWTVQRDGRSETELLSGAVAAECATDEVVLRVQAAATGGPWRDVAPVRRWRRGAETFTSLRDARSAARSATLAHGRSRVLAAGHVVEEYLRDETLPTGARRVATWH